MKTSRVIFTLLAAMMFASCSEPEKEPQVVAELSVSGISSMISADAGGDHYSFSVTSNKNWKITTVDLGWAQFSATKGNADQQVQVTLTVPEYDKEPTREGTFTIIAAEATKIYTVRQTGVTPVAYDTHAAGYEFFLDDFNWITALWPSKFANSKYGWVSVKVDESEWNEYGILTDAPTAAEFDSRGYIYDGANTYCRYEGYVKLGRAAIVGSLASPALSGIDDATIATLSVKWDAGTYVTASGTLESYPQISISVDGNGSIANCGTDGATIEATGKKAIIPLSGDEDHRFRWTRKEVVVTGADKDTRIVFGASEEIKARCFIDNISITRAAEGASAGNDAIQPLPAFEKDINMLSDMPIDGGTSNANLYVRINREWSIASDSEWLTVSKVASGASSDGIIAENKLSATVPGTWLPYNNTVLRAEPNPDTTAPRSATVTVSAEGAIQATFTVTQAPGETPPDPNAPRVLAEWNFSGITSGSTKGASWIAGGTAASDDESGSTLKYMKGAKNKATPTFTLGTTTMNKNRLRSHDLYLDDCLEFTVSVKALAAGSTVSFENAFISATQYGPKYWMQEYSLDNGTTWKPAVATVTEKTDSPTDPTRDVIYTHMLPSQDKLLSLDCVIAVPEAIESGYLKLRIRVADLAQAKTSNGDMTTPNKIGDVGSIGITYILSSQDLFTTETRNSVLTVDGVFFRFNYTPPTP